MNKLTVPQIIILAAGAVMLLGSFLDFINDENAWSIGAIALLALLCGVAMAAVVALVAFANVRLPAEILGFTWKQIHLVLAMYAALMMLGWLLYKIPSVVVQGQKFGGKDLGGGFWLMFLAAIGLVVGAVMLQNQPDAAGTPVPGTTPPTPF